MRPRKDILVSVCFIVVTSLLVMAIWWAWRQYVTDPPYVDPEQFPVRGIDVSSHNGMMNLDAAARDGVEFIWIKASEGADFRAANFALNYQKAQHAGLKTGAYHFFRFNRGGVEQALNLLRVVSGRRLELGIAVDVEEHGNPRTDTDSVLQRLQTMTEYLNLRGYRVTFYTNKDGYAKYLSEYFRGFPMWICSFTDDSVGDDWAFWQYDHHAKVKGIQGDVDMNAFCGSREQWDSLWRRPVPGVAYPLRPEK